MPYLDVTGWEFKTREMLTPIYQEVADTIIEEIQERFKHRLPCTLKHDEKTGLPYVEFDLFEDGPPLEIEIGDSYFVDEAIEWMESSLTSLRAKRAELEKLAEASRL